jgi:SAM-dependent methyltransferase
MGSAGVQGPLWSGGAQDWADYQEAWHLPLWRDALKAVRATAGASLLDAGCGAGGAAVEADRLGCSVTGVDASTGMLAIARRRLPRAPLLQADLESLPFDDRSFDAVVAINSVIFARDMTRAASELARVARPGSRVVITVRGNPGESDMTGVSEAVARYLQDDQKIGGPFALAGPGALEGLVEGAGLRIAERGASPCLYRYPDLETCWRGLSSAGPVRAAVLNAGEETVRGAVEEVVKRLAGADGAIVLRAVYIWAAGERA